MGIYPVYMPTEGDPAEVAPGMPPLSAWEIARWQQAHERCSFVGRVRQALDLRALWRFGLHAYWRVLTSRCDGWHFVKCQTCGGSGKRRGA